MSTPDWQPALAPHGVIICATGDESMAEAELLLGSIRRHSPTLPIMLFTDRDRPAAPHLSIRRFDPAVLNRRNYNKIITAIETPFETTIFMDADMWMTQPVDDLFEAMQGYDFAATHATERDIYRDRRKAGSVSSADAPDLFPERNSGFLVLRRSDATWRLLTMWRDIYRRHFQARNGRSVDEAQSQDRQRDQPAFREAAWKSGARELCLTHEWNLHLALPSVVKGPVRILHCHQWEFPRDVLPGARSFAEAERLINADESMRINIPHYGMCNIPPKASQLRALSTVLARDVFRRVVRKVTSGRIYT